MDNRPSWERDLDRVVKPTLVADPPQHLQQSILAAVLQATARPVAAPVMMPAPAARPIPLVAYVLLAAVLVAYVAGLSWLHGFFNDSGWLSILAAQLLAVSDLVVGRPATGEPMTVAWTLLQRAPWIALLPLAWWLWERDRAGAPVA